MKSAYLLLSLLPFALTSLMSSCQCPQVDCTAKATSANCSCLNYCCAAEIGTKPCGAPPAMTSASGRNNTMQIASATVTSAGRNITQPAPTASASAIGNSTGTAPTSTMAYATRNVTLSSIPSRSYATSTRVSSQLSGSAPPPETSSITEPAPYPSATGLPIPILSSILAEIQDLNISLSSQD